jgi:hypothetical protein
VDKGGQRWRWDGSRCFIAGRTPRHPRLRPSPHLHQKEFGKPGALEAAAALPLEKGNLSHASVPALRAIFLFSRKKGEGRKNSYQFKNWRITSPTKPLGSCHLYARKDQQVHRRLQETTEFANRA